MIKDIDNTKWKDNVQRLVLYADFMGFKSRVYGSEHSQLKELLDRFNTSWHNKLKSLQNTGNLEFIQFSDSILVVTNEANPEMFELITKAAVSLVHEALKIQFGIKGVIAQGIFSFDKENGIYFGKPLVDAYLLHEEIKYYGIVVHHSAENILKNSLDINRNVESEDDEKENETKKLLLPYTKTDIFIEKGKVSHYHLAWNMVDFDLTSEKNITDECNSLLDAIEETVSGNPRQYIDRTRKVMDNDKNYFEPNVSDISNKLDNE